MSSRRKDQRVPLITQVEERLENVTALGHAHNVSVGGLLVQTRETVKEGATVVVRFTIPPDTRPIEAAGRVVWVEAGKAMGINFLGLLEAQRQRIEAYVNSLPDAAGETSPAAETSSQAGRRRSARLARRMPIILIWQNEEGHSQQEAAETVLLSLHGAMVLSYTLMQPGQLVWVSVPETNKKELSRVVWARAAGTSGRVEMALEILGERNFWELEFPPYEPEPVPPPRRGRRRRGRLTRRLEVILSWRDEWGRAREEPGHTCTLSWHGALVSTNVPLLVNQKVSLRAPEMNREATVRIVYAAPGAVPGQADLGVEFIGVEDFWGLSFALDTPPPEVVEALNSAAKG